ncbi:MAG TPA: AMP-dependent synthetase/ligase [Ilumatobacteraceae bacterium]|jgi:long-chain acyl-CoA synthetase|nr:AMP-dependent synthetase/ligase [Ilumatobacteraceae bacterium]
MRNETSGPAFGGIADDANLLQPLLRLVEQDGDRVIALTRDGDRFVDWTVAGTAERIRAVAKGLVACGVEPGERVALMCHTRFEWVVVDMAIMSAGAVTVPVYDTSSAEQLSWILQDSGAVVAILENGDMRAMYDGLDHEALSCRHVFTIDDSGGPGLDDLTELGADVDDGEIDRRSAALGHNDIATVIYTSGTTGRPKGCVLTHGNLCANVAQTVDAIGDEIRPDDVGLLFLPLAHSLTKGNLLFSLEMGVRTGFATDIAHLGEELGMVHATVIAAVPRVFEKVYNSAQHTAHTTRKGPIFDRAASVAVKWSKEQHRGSVGRLTALEHALFERLVYRKLRHALGGAMRLAFSGGSPLGDRLTHFFDGIGVRIFEGYGLTETSPTLTLNRPGAWRPGSVGRPLAGTTIRIADDGEILAKGPQVFVGYWNNPEATAEVIDDDGWFHTGDIGELDDDGFLRITGRKKELIVTAAGKNVAPAPLEDRLRAHPLVSQAVVVGDQRPFVAALITIDEAAFVDWASDVGLSARTVAEAADSAELRAAVREAVDEANLSVSRAESIREFAILPRDFSIDAEELTPTLKVRRSVVHRHCRAAIDSIYGD